MTKIVKKICFYIGDRIVKFGYWFLRVTGNMVVIEMPDIEEDKTWTP